MNFWIDRISAIVIILFAIGWCIDIFRKRHKKSNVEQALHIIEKVESAAQLRGRPPLTPPPEPIDRNEFLQARIAYLAHMRDIGIEVEDEDENGVKKKHIRRATPVEMIENVNIRDKDHIDQLLETWDQVQKKQRERSL